MLTAIYQTHDTVDVFIAVYYDSTPVLASH